MNSNTTSPVSVGARRVDDLLAHYGASHQNAKNELIHFIAIPMTSNTCGWAPLFVISKLFGKLGLRW